MRYWLLTLVLLGCDEESAIEVPFEPIGRSLIDASTEPDGARPDWSVDERPLRLDFLRVASDADVLRATDLAFLPDAPAEFLLFDKDGHIVHQRLEGETARTLMRLQLPVHSDKEGGVVSAVVDRDFATNHYFYVSSTEEAETATVRRFTLFRDDPEATLNSGVRVFELPTPGVTRAIHNIGQIGMEPSGVLWLTAGERNQKEAAADPFSPLGKLLRMIPNAEGGARPAPDNPFAGGDGHPMVYALGLRNPWRATLHDGRWFVADVGRDAHEELNLIDSPALDFGFPAHEGACEPDCTTTVTPWMTYKHGDSPVLRADPDAAGTHRRSIYVTPMYEPGKYGAPDPYQGRWNDVLVYGDFFNGWIRGRSVDADPGIDNPAQDWFAGHLALPSGWDQGPDGYMYVMTLGAWPIADEPYSAMYRVVPGR